MAGFTHRSAHRRGFVLVAGLGVLAAACFDSDQKAAWVAGTSTGAASSGTTLVPPDPWTTEQGGSGSPTMLPPPEATCRDAIQCVTGCAASIPMPLPPEPDLSCFLECETGLNGDEALALLRLTDCVAQRCAEKGRCGGASTDTGSSSGTTGTTGEGGLDPCTDCILTSVLDPQPPGCLEEGEACD